MTLVEVIVVLMISSISLSIVGTLFYHSMNYFQTTANQSLEKQVVDGITSYMRNELLYASDIVVAKEKPDNTEWYELSVDAQGHLRKDEESIYNESFYMEKTVDLSIQFIGSNKITMNLSLLNDQTTSIYSKSTTLELLNVNNTLSDSKQIYNISHDQGNGYKIYYKKNMKQIVDDADNEDIETKPDYEGTIYDELRCRNENISDIDSNGNNKGVWIKGANYQKGDFVEYNQVIYRAIKDITNSKNPFENTVLPKTEYKKRDIWNAETIRIALDQCTDNKLYIAMNLAFACSLRMGEILGLRWKNVFIEDEHIMADNAYIYIDAELTRASKQAIEMLGEKDIYYIFTPLMPNTSTRLILKKPKTDSSIRKVWLPKTLAYILREWRKAQEELKSFLGDEYQDFDLVVALPNGRPCENRIIEKEFSILKEKAGLPNVVFHSLRHSSTTYKLKLNHGDLKATQGDTGHAEIDMITKVYAHILDEDRKVNAQKFENAFYAVNRDLKNVQPPQEQPAAPTLDLSALIEQLQKSPELAQTLAALIGQQNQGLKAN